MAALMQTPPRMLARAIRVLCSSCTAPLAMQTVLARPTAGFRPAARAGAPRRYRLIVRAQEASGDATVHVKFQLPYQASCRGWGRV